MEVKYLGVIITPNSVHMDPAKVKAILNWPPLQNVKKDTPWDWNNKCQSVFLLLKKAFTSAPVLCHFDPSQPIMLKCDASNSAITGILFQSDSRGKKLHPVTFYICSMIPTELNYDTYNKELLAIIKAFHQWQAYLKGSCTASKSTLTITTCNTSWPQNYSAAAKLNGPKPSQSTTLPSTTTPDNLA
ncbi:hypothetical protein E4T56_gene3658 [Termitomyces sp. T112]|nr:hypothetical protein E4T56_gene3658 [Termitomyces sp. T112]